MKNIFFYIFLLIILIFSIFLRYYLLGNSSFWIDEGYSSIISYNMLKSNFLPILGNGNLEFSQIFFHFFQSISFKYLGISDFSARLPSFIFGLLNIIIYFLFSKKLSKNLKYKNIFLLFLMFLFCFSTWQIIWSREARFYEMLSFLFFSCSYFFYQYFIDDNKKYLYLLLLFIYIGTLFHPFFYSLLLLFTIYSIFNFYTKKNKTILVKAIILIFTIIITQLILKYFQGTSLVLENIKKIIIPNVNIYNEFFVFGFLKYYLGVLFSQLGIIFLSFIFYLFYIFYLKKYKELTFLSLLFLVNIISISFGYMAHSRYIYHLFGIITLFGGYNLFLFYENYLDKKKYILKVPIILIFFSLIIATFSLSFSPKFFYNIDNSSPKPNFKSVYEFINKNYKNDFIVSGFPHMCFWYNINNTSKCKYAIKVNLIGENFSKNNFSNKITEDYTNTTYIENLNNIDYKNTLFVLDDLTIKNSINKKIINEIKNNCLLIYSDLPGVEEYNFIGIWKCN